MSRTFTSRLCVYQICRCVMWWSRKAHSAVVGLLLIPSVLPELSDVCCKHVGLRVVQCVRQALEDLGLHASLSLDLLVHNVINEIASSVVQSPSCLDNKWDEVSDVTVLFTLGGIVIAGSHSWDPMRLA